MQKTTDTIPLGIVFFFDRDNYLDLDKQSATFYPDKKKRIFFFAY